MRRDRPGLPCRDSFAVVFEARGRRIAGKILDPGLRVLLQVSAHKQVVFLVDRVVELENAGVQRTRIRAKRRYKTRSYNHPPGWLRWATDTAGTGPARRRFGPGVVQTPLARQGVSRVAIWAAVRVLVEVCAQVGIGRIDTVLISDVSLAISGAGHNAGLLRIFRSPLPFVVEEKEELVFLDRAAERAAKSVADELARLVRLSQIATRPAC